MIEIITYLNQDHYLLTLNGNVDTEKLTVLNKKLEQCLETPVPAVLISCDQVTDVCIAGLRSLLHYQKLFHIKNKKIIVFGLKPELESVFLDTGLDRFITVVLTYNQALHLIRKI